MAPRKTRTLRAADIEEYVLFRQRLEEFLHLFAVWDFYRKKPREDPEWPINLTIHVALMVWLHSFFDPRGIDVRSLWKRVFPWLRPQLEVWRRKIDPDLKLLEELRHITGAHFSRRIKEHNRVREAMTGGPGPKGGAARRLMELFVEMARDVTIQEPKQPQIANAVASYGFTPAVQ